MLRFNDIADRILEYNPGCDLQLLQRAYVFSAKVHEGQERLSGEPYLVHPLEVAGILVEMRMDEVTVAAGLLHDAIEDTLTTPDELRRLFGEPVAFLVEGLTKIAKIEFTSLRERQAENFRKMLIAMSRDIRILMIKLADRLHNMRTLRYMPEESRHRVAQETLDIYVPLAHRLGIYWMKRELEELAYRTLKPEAVEELERRLREKSQAQGEYIREVIGILSKQLAEAGLQAEVTGRLKDLASIHQKMETQGLTLDEIYDVIAFRVILDGGQEHVYAALGIVHSIWRPVPGRFKDYVALPKQNGYQSLHTTVIGPYGERMEIQIRTREMHQNAEFGIAAHWKYKEGRLDPHGGGGRGQVRLAAPAARVASGARRSPRVHRPGEGRPLPRRGLRLHAQGRGDQPLEGRHADRLRLRDPHAGGRALLGGEGERQAGAAAASPRRRRHRRDHHQPGAVPAQGLARVRGLGARAQQDPPRPARAREGARPGARPRDPRPRSAQGGPLAAAPARERRPRRDRAGRGEGAGRRALRAGGLRQARLRRRGATAARRDGAAAGARGAAASRSVPRASRGAAPRASA